MIVRVTHTDENGKVDADFTVRVRADAANAIDRAKAVAIAATALDDPRYTFRIERG